jgi:hypothetical protein
MIARRAVPYRGHTYRPGDQFDAVPIDAAMLRYQGLADFAPSSVSATDVPVSKRKYRRRDLQAED